MVRWTSDWDTPFITAGCAVPRSGITCHRRRTAFWCGSERKIKRWKTGVDVLTLSATPIPRTLHLALVNGRDMSVIESPPEERLPVETYVAEYNPGMIKEALEREMRRGGRIYYVHNRFLVSKILLPICAVWCRGSISGSLMVRCQRICWKMQ